MKKVIIVMLISLVSVAMASESIGTKNCAATQSSQKREIGKKIAPTPQAAPEEKKASAVTQE